MKKYNKTVLVVGMLLIIGLPYMSFAEEWIRMEQAPFEKAPQAIRAGKPGSSILYLADQSNLYLSHDNGKTWDRTFRLGWNGKINKIETVKNNPLFVYACTSNGLYESKDEGKNWSKIYSGTNEKTRNILSFAQNPFDKNMNYIGTANGVFISKDGGKSWAHAFAELSRKQISDIQIDEQNNEIYFAANNELYRYHLLLDSFRKVFSESISTLESDSSDVEAGNENQDGESLVTSQARVITTSDSQFSVVFTGKKGIFASNDEGETWAELSSEGLGNLKLIDIVYSERLRTLFTATSKGIFQYNQSEEIWQEIYKGLVSAEIFGIAIQNAARERLIAATKNGIFSYEIELPKIEETGRGIDNVHAENLFPSLLLEPPIREIQKQAIRYANVGNAKIKRWHAGSRLRSFIPDLTFSKGLDVDNNIHVDTGSTTSPDVFVQGPDARGRSSDVSLKWSLGDLIFNSSQTSIDSREKTMVEFRDEILNEVTRLYFERKRAQIDFLTNPPREGSERLKALLRIEELTANLDALTDGYLSHKLEKLYKERPEFARLWKTD